MDATDTARPVFRAALDALGAGAATIADVGARWGAADSWFRMRPLARLIGFEPDPVECARLNEAAATSQERFYPVALGGVDGTGTLHVTQEPACSSLFPPSAAILDRYPSLRAIMTPVRTETVPLSTLATWAANAGVDRLDFLKLDTQGAELDILQGAGRLLDTCLGIEAEVMFSPLYDGQPLFADVDAFLRSRGFTLWRLDSLAHYTDRPSDRLAHTATTHYESKSVAHPAGDGRLIWANAIYFRDREQVRDRRSRLILAALLEAAGDADGARACLDDALSTEATPAPSILPDMADDIPSYPGADSRIRMTISCDDCRHIPKVPLAGQTREENGTRVQIMHNGIRVVEGGYHGGWMAEIIRRLKGHHEPQEEFAFSEILRHARPGGTMIELGAFWAYYSLWFAQAVPGSRCVLVEPDPNNLAIGKTNFSLNGVSGEFQQASVGRISTPPRPFPCESDGQYRPLPELCVDDLIRDHRLPRVELLLADIQGAELRMLEGAAESVRRGLIRFVFVSTHHHCISGDPLTHQKCLQLVRDLGGHVLVEHSVAESFSGDGLLVASFDPADRSLPPIAVSRNRTSCSLFPEVEYDLAAAWDALAAVHAAAASFAHQDPRLAAALNGLRERNAALGRLWSPLGAKAA
jgi:FkbM family methyltransferase